MNLQALRPRLAAIPLVFAASAACAAAEMKELLGRLPGEANAIAVLDIQRILQTPMAQKEGWKEKIAEAYGTKPFIVPPGAEHVALAALIDPTTMESVWEVAVMDLNAAPAIAAIARGDHGLPDTVGEKPAVWSPINAYFVQLESQILGTVAPANRQFAARWARKKYTLGGAFMSGYLRTAAASLESGTEFALAMDLEDVVNPKRAMVRIKSGEFPCLTDNKGVDIDAITKVISSLKGVTLRVEIGQDATAKCSVDFGEDATPLTPVAKPLFLEVLSRVGASLDDAADWTASVKRNSLVLEGKVSPNGLRHLFSLIEPPSPRRVAEAAHEPSAPEPKPSPGEQPAAPADPKAAASQAYFKTVDGILSRLGTRVGAGAKHAGLADTAAWLARDAKRIGRLPISNVDPDLVAWGGDVSARLRDAAQSFTSGSIAAKGRTAGITETYSADYDDSTYDPYNDNELARAEGQRRQAAAEERARALEGASGSIRDLLLSRDQIRAAMVKRYNMEF